MENKLLTLSYLETLSSADLIDLADDYGLDIPDDLSRRFIIGELLELAEELKQDPSEEEMIAENGEEDLDSNTNLPAGYNETQIVAMLRNPAWVYVYWDIKEVTFTDVTSNPSFNGFVLRVSFFDDEVSNAPVESFDVQITLQDRQQYIMLSPGRKYFRVDLVALFNGKPSDNLAVSKKIAIPSGSNLLTDSYPGMELDVSPVMELSGIRSLLKRNYENHRQSFSN